MDADCQHDDPNKECINENCVCKTGFHPSATGVCVQGKNARYSNDFCEDPSYLIEFSRFAKK